MEHGLEQSCSGLDHLGRELLTGFIDELNESLAPCTVRAYLTDLLTVARALAPDRAFPALHGAVRHIWRRARPVKNKRARMVPTQDLYDFGFELMSTAGEAINPVNAARRFRDGLLIALLAARPLRLSNLATITIGRHLEHHGNHYSLSFEPADVKNRRALTFPLPRELTGQMDRYLGEDRPLLIAEHGRWKDDPADALWVSAHGSRLKRARIKEIISERTTSRFGRPVNVHLFRDAAATAVAIGDPEHIGIIAAILGHGAAQTGERFNNEATSIEAARRFQTIWHAYREPQGSTVRR